MKLIELVSDLETLVRLAKKYGVDDIEELELAETIVKEKKKHWTQRPGAKAKMTKAMKKVWKTRKKNA